MSAIPPNATIPQGSNNPPILYFQYTASALVIYEHMITVNQEIRYTWRYRMSATTIILLVNRYLLLGLAIVMVFDAFIPSTTCSKVSAMTEVIQALLLTIGAGFSTIRILAISAWKARIVAYIAFICGMVPAAITMYSAVLQAQGMIQENILDWSEQLYFTPEVCMVLGAVSSNGFGISSYSRIGAITSDVLVVIITWVQAIRINGINGRTFRHSLFALLLRDGTAYFLVLVTANLIQLLDRGITGENTSGAEMSYLCWLFATGILTSRFIFNLRQFANGSDAGTNPGYSSSMSIDISTQPRLPFNADSAAGSIMGNIGASLDHGFSDESSVDGGYGDDDEDHQTR